MEMVVGKSSYYIHGNDVSFFSDVLEKDGIVFDSLKTVPLNPDNGIIKVWIVGELIDYLKEKS